MKETASPKKLRPNTQMTSRTSSVKDSLNASTSSVSLYPKCAQKKQHAKQLLNLICLSSTCKLRGPICSMCKASDHSDHMVIPLKVFLTNLSANLNKNSTKMEEKSNVMSEGEPLNIFSEEGSLQSQIDSSIKSQQEALSILKAHKIEMFSMLAIYVNKVSAEIQRVEAKIISDFAALEDQLSRMFEVQNNSKKIVEQLIESPPSDSQTYTKQINSLLSVLFIKSKEEYLLKNDCWESKISEWKAKGDYFMANIETWGEHSEAALKAVFDATEIVKKTSTPPAAGGTWKFSSSLKMKSIVVGPNSKQVKQTVKSPGLAFIEGENIKDKTLRLKITTAGSPIAVGIGLKDVLKAKQYKPDFSKLGHGVFLNSSNTYTYSHYDKEINMKMLGISFAAGSEVTLHAKANTLEVVAKGNTKVASIPLKKMTEAEWKQAAFCVHLGGSGDKVDIIDA